MSITAAAASGISVAGCLGIIGSDHARYFSVSAISVDHFDYDATKTAAETAGYTIDGPYYGTLKETSVGFHPDGIDDLDERFGPDYRVDHVVFHYSLTTRVSAGFREDSDTELYLRDERAWASPDPFLPEYLPEEDWLIERLTLLFDMGSERAREYIAQLMDAITAEQTDLPSIDISEPVTFAAVYQYVVQESTAVKRTHSHGEGWHIVTYARDGTPFAEIGYRLQSTKVTHKSGTGTYIVQFDPLGAIGLEITLPAGESIPEDERRSVFREMFSSLGLPPELVDDVEFDYVGSMW
ncbi:hypothetical protein ACERIT_16065 [Halopenitus sp. H-Gu1]|uniref:hypothetical protein n=1 Tax=Halopenitus sp. H-Gu1 TaxID=3242697 RepID=UPI00359E9B16